MQEMNNSVKTSELLETFDGMELIEATWLVSGGDGDLAHGGNCGEHGWVAY